VLAHTLGVDGLLYYLTAQICLAITPCATAILL